MTNDLENLLTTALAETARARIGDDVPPPPPRFAGAAPSFARRRIHLLAPLAVAALVAAVVVGSLVLANALTRTPAPPATPTAAPVDVSMQAMPAGRTGVGMPVVAYFSKRFPDARAWQAATRVTVNGSPVQADWYFTRTSGARRVAYPIEGHLRMRGFWPAHATISVHVDARHASAGPGLAFARNAETTFRTGAACIAKVSGNTLRLTVDGRPTARFPVSLGRRQTPTMSGWKVILAKNPDRRLTGPGYSIAHVQDTQQLTTTGEYLLAAPWDVSGIQRGFRSTGGSTDLMPADARRLYRLTTVGDPVRYVGSSHVRMTMRDGIGDWNVSWQQWRTGGLIPTR
jgi:lipoprotein-anchoring transpeptidase ErfK/SrfK